MEALEKAEITRGDDGPSGFQLTFRAEKTGTPPQVYDILSGGDFEIFNRIVVNVTVAGHTSVLIDGVITHQQFQPSDQPGQSLLVITGEDISVMMDRREYNITWPHMTDILIVGTILAKYKVFYGIDEELHAPLTSFAALIFQQSPQQSGTDLSYIKQLAFNHAFFFYIKPGSPGSFRNTAYWGPMERSGPTQKVLTINSGPMTNVESLTISYNGLCPHFVWGMVEKDLFISLPIPVITLESTRSPPFATKPALTHNSPGAYKLFQHQGMGVIEAYTTAQAMTDTSTDDVVTVQGTLDTFRYGHVLQAPGRVALRGAGPDYDGLYYVKTVTHHLSVGEYKQDFTLTREGTGSTISQV